MADDNGIKKPPSVGPAPGSRTPPIDPAKVDEESFSQRLRDRYFPPNEGTAPQWMSRILPKNYNHFLSPDGDIEIRFQPNISDDPIPSTLVQIKGLENPEEAIHFFYDFARHAYACSIIDKQEAEPSWALSALWLRSAKCYAGAFEDDSPLTYVESITLQDALNRISYQMASGNGLVTLEATLVHLWAYWVKRAESATSDEEKRWSGSMAKHIRISLSVMTCGNHDELIDLFERTAWGCIGRWQGWEENAPQSTPDLELLTPLHNLITAEMCYRKAACSEESAVRRGLLLKAQSHSKMAAAFGNGISNAVGKHASNLDDLVENGITASPVIGSCAPIGINVPAYGPTAASITPLNPGFFLVRPLTPIV